MICKLSLSTLDGNEMVPAEAASMMFMADGIQMNRGTGGGLLKGVKRILTAESFLSRRF